MLRQFLLACAALPILAFAQVDEPETPSYEVRGKVTLEKLSEIQLSPKSVAESNASPYSDIGAADIDKTGRFISLKQDYEAKKLTIYDVDHSGKVGKWPLDVSFETFSSPY